MLIALLAGTAPFLWAQSWDVEVEDEQPSPWAVRMLKKGFHLLVDPSQRLDTAYVYQMPLRWTFGVDGPGRRLFILHLDVPRLRPKKRRGAGKEGDEQYELLTHNTQR